MKVSVIVPTMRVGGIDVLMVGLAEQTYKDFEVILVDGLHKYRAGLLDAFRLDSRHIPPVGDPFPKAAFCRYANTGLAAATGDIVVMVTDYTCLPKDCLELHVRFHKEAVSPKEALMLPHKYVACAGLKQGIPTYPRANPKATQAYVDDLEAGRLNHAMYSIFDPLLTPERIRSLPQDDYVEDPKLKMLPGPIDRSYFHAKNASVKRSELVAINGWNEALDGGHTYQDTDLADRLYKERGTLWTLLHCDPVRIVNPREIFPSAAWERAPEDNKAIWESNVEANYAEPVRGLQELPCES